MSKMRVFSLFIILIIGTGIHTGCDKDGGINIFTLKQDRQFGEDFDQEIQQNDDYDVLPKSQYPNAYDHLNRIKSALLQSDNLNHGDDFEWQAKIIRDDEVLNAFAVPGGYMYFYTGLIQYLDNEAQFAGVMAHEMAHVDKRHTTKRMTKLYGFQFLLGMILGENPEAWAKIAADLALGLGSLQFSRNDEYEADEFAVKYTADTELNPKGVAGFFIKLEDENRPKTPEFLSTHPSPDNRIEQINNVWEKIGSPAGQDFSARYQEFIDALP
jgi:beta-barrel assembly-enhancing protease